MNATTGQERRIRPRVSVTLKAAVSFAGHEGEQHQAMISNLSATGARLHLEKASPMRVGAGINLKIYIPGTVLHLDIEGEIFWVRRQHEAVSLGVRFNEAVSGFMLQRLIEK